MSEEIWYTMIQDFTGDWWVCPSDKVGESLMYLKWLYNTRKSGGVYNPDYAPCPKGCYPIGRPDLVEFTRCRPKIEQRGDE